MVPEPCTCQVLGIHIQSNHTSSKDRGPNNTALLPHHHNHPPPSSFQIISSGSCQAHNAPAIHHRLKDLSTGEAAQAPDNQLQPSHQALQAESLQPWPRVPNGRPRISHPDPHHAGPPPADTSGAAGEKGHSKEELSLQAGPPTGREDERPGGLPAVPVTEASGVTAATLRKQRLQRLSSTGPRGARCGCGGGPSPGGGSLSAARPAAGV